MSVGYPKTQDVVNATVGELAQSLNRSFRRLDQFKVELDSFTDPQLTAAGYTAGEITTLRTLAADSAQLASIYRGAATLGTVKDFRTSLRPGWGVLGDF